MEEIIQEIQELVQAYFGCTAEQFTGSFRHPNVSNARTVYVRTLYSLRVPGHKRRIINGPKISNILGKSQSRMIYYHIQRFDKLFADPVYRRTIESFDRELQRRATQWKDIAVDLFS